MHKGNFMDAFMCYKQKCKVASLNLAHPVHLKNITTHARAVRDQWGFSASDTVYYK